MPRVDTPGVERAWVLDGSLMSYRPLMPTVAHTRTGIRRAEKPVSWDAISALFDRIWGPEQRGLPRFPQVIGGVGCVWFDGKGVRYDAASLDEIRDAYERFETARIIIRSRLEETVLEYIPAERLVSFSVTSEDPATVETGVLAVEELFPLAAEVVFISYDTENLDLADAFASLLRARLDPGTEVFVAKRSIAPGDDPLKRMLDGGILRARALVAVCTPSSKGSPWLWWETGAVWARGELVIPLFAGISAKEFDGPLRAVRQGGDCTNREDVDRILNRVVQHIRPGRECSETTDEEFRPLQEAMPNPKSS